MDKCKKNLIKTLSNLKPIKYNKTLLNFKDVNLFNISKKSDNDNVNKKRELIISAIINDVIPKDYLRCSLRWYNLQKQIFEYLKNLYDNKIYNIQCIHKAGRKYHYDLKLIINEDAVFNLEFKFNAESVDKTPQFVSPMYPSKYLEYSYEKYYYENYLIKLSNEFDKFPTKEEYINNIHSVKPEIVSKIQDKYYHGCNKSSKYTANKNDILFYKKCKKLAKESIGKFITNYSLDKDKLSDYLSKTQQNKFYMLYKNGKMNFQTIDHNDYIIKDIIKEPNKSRYIAITKSNRKLKILLRWKNGNGIAFPALQISQIS